ncbi:hypothetical protein TNIN_356231 [Trichonephila inaurata madagascariensis]|uniref:Uncharacterized protein n=1 Tax=Trichonephila inaurata madagascariensis TaxID=2747483 RepID=A0A8X6XDN1_9ARAC|nr:hypothetical protein TNIN_356231 [Trichonephila inaurata madagascariensis]
MTSYVDDVILTLAEQTDEEVTKIPADYRTDEDEKENTVDYHTNEDVKEIISNYHIDEDKKENVVSYHIDEEVKEITADHHANKDGEENIVDSSQTKIIFRKMKSFYKKVRKDKRIGISYQRFKQLHDTIYVLHKVKLIETSIQVCKMAKKF